MDAVHDVWPRFSAVGSKIQARGRAATLVDRPIQFLVREVLAQLTKGVRPIRPIGRYQIDGRRFQLEHGTQDIATFEEIFVHRFYDLPEEVKRSLGSSKPRIIDLGGNIGLFGLWVLLNAPQSDVVIFEPDSTSQKRYQEFLDRNGLSWRLENACATSHDGEVLFSSGLEAISSISEYGEGTPVRSVDVLPLLDQIDLIKMDIEGGEWEILQDPRFADTKCKAIALEYHRHLCPSADPRTLAEQLLSGAGFKHLDIFHKEEEGFGMLWGYRETAG